MNNLVADGALHEHEVELLLLVLHRVLFAGLSADETHSCVGQDGLEEKHAERRVGSFKQNLCYRLYMLQQHLKGEMRFCASLSVVLKPLYALQSLCGRLEPLKSKKSIRLNPLQAPLNNGPYLAATISRPWLL